MFFGPKLDQTQKSHISNVNLILDMSGKYEEGQINNGFDESKHSICKLCKRNKNNEKNSSLFIFFYKIIQTNISENYHLKIENKRSPFALDVGFFDKNVKIDELIQLPGLCSSTRIKERKEKCSTFVNSFIT